MSHLGVSIIDTIGITAGTIGIIVVAYYHMVSSRDETDPVNLLAILVFSIAIITLSSKPLFAHRLYAPLRAVVLVILIGLQFFSIIEAHLDRKNWLEELDHGLE